MNFNRNYLAAEKSSVDEMIALAGSDHACRHSVETRAARLIDAVRGRPERLTALDRFLGEYDLAHTDGVVLMCLAESLLRIPDTKTADALIADKLSGPDWSRHLGAEDLLVNASTWGLMLTGQLLPDFDQRPSNVAGVFKNLLGRLGEPLIRNATRHAMRIIGDQFVIGTTMAKALVRSQRDGHEYETFSFDVLGEGAVTKDDAERYFNSYLQGIEEIGRLGRPTSIDTAPGISVKLSALSPRFAFTQRTRAVAEISERLSALATRAAAHGIQLTVDAEETDRLDMTLAIFFAVLAEKKLRDWGGLGLAVQAYQKRSLDVIRALHEAAIDVNGHIHVRLVKGAYWDSEIKLAQTRGLRDYPVFTRKCNTDVAYLACARALLESPDRISPQFATHNARTVAWVTQLAGRRSVEFQRLHGMGEALYGALHENDPGAFSCRVYSPVGAHNVLLPYLVRRLLENGANSSFVHRIADPEIAIEQLVSDPIAAAGSIDTRRHPRISLPCDIFGPQRRGAAGLNFADPNECDELVERIRKTGSGSWIARPIVGGIEQEGDCNTVIDSSDHDRVLGEVTLATRECVIGALDVASASWNNWNATHADTRAEILEKIGSAIESDHDEILALIVRETGRTIMDAHAELREAIDFLRYYACECRRLFGGEIELPGPAGENNRLSLCGRGVVAAISPWNFPVSIFVGQIAAALAAGNTVIAKPAEQSSLVAARICAEFYRAGVPVNVLQFLPGRGAEVGAVLLADPRIAAVVFTGSTKVARLIAAQLVAKPGPSTALVAETGGINCMIVDSSALPEQVVADVVDSAFNSAGQRCSALRVLYLQRDIAEKVLTLLRGYLEELVIGDPMELETDIGPIIDSHAAQALQNYITAARAAGTLNFALTPPTTLRGNFVGPCLINIEHIKDIPGEIFGPVLHVRTFEPDDLIAVCDEINSTGYGLTLGIHSRIDHRVDDIIRRVSIGNIYVNRNMIGAVVESQPFGGLGLSGTGPKAGGPHYLLRLANERTVSINTAAIGGNATLISLSDDPAQ